MVLWPRPAPRRLMWPPRARQISLSDKVSKGCSGVSSMCSSEFFVRVGRRRVDAPLHDPILNNPTADKVFAEVAIRQAMDLGIDEDVAREVLDPE